MGEGADRASLAARRIMSRVFGVIAGLVPATPLRPAPCVPKRGPRDTSAFTRVFDPLCPRMTTVGGARGRSNRRRSAFLPRHLEHVPLRLSHVFGVIAGLVPATPLS